jgi:hypothetical protein
VVLQQTANTGQLCHAEEVLVVFIVSGGYASVLFKRADEAFHHVAACVEQRLDARWTPPAAAALAWGELAARNHSPDVAPAHLFAQRLKE